MIYFDNAATTFPKPRATVEAANTVFTRYGANPGRGGHTMAMETAQMVYRARSELIHFLGGEEAERVIFVQNCTQAVNIAVKGILRQGDHVILSSMEHNAVWRPVEALKAGGLIEYDVAQVYPDSPGRTLQSFRALIRANTRLVCCVHGSNVFGTLQPVAELCALAHAHGALFLLDAAQTAGIVGLDMGLIPADFICLAAHKGLYAPTALGALIVGCDEELNTLIEGGSGSLSLESGMPPFLPDRLEAGTLNTTGIAGLLGGLRFLRSRGVENLHRQEMEITALLYSRLAAIPGVVLYNRPQLPVLSFGVEGMTGEAVAEALSKQGFALRGGFHCSPLAHRTMGTIETGTARIGVGAFNTRKQALDLIEAVKGVARGKG